MIYLQTCGSTPAYVLLSAWMDEMSDLCDIEPLEGIVWPLYSQLVMLLISHVLSFSLVVFSLSESVRIGAHDRPCFLSSAACCLPNLANFLSLVRLGTRASSGSTFQSAFPDESRAIRNKTGPKRCRTLLPPYFLPDFPSAVWKGRLSPYTGAFSRESRRLKRLLLRPPGAVPAEPG